MKKSSYYKQSNGENIKQVINWQDHDLGDSLFYSYRSTLYNSNTFPSSLHYHNYYELVILEEGNIDYICESTCVHPKIGDILLISPGMFHMSKIGCEETNYKRHVFYLYPDALDGFGCGALVGFLKEASKGIAVFSPLDKNRSMIFTLLHQLSQALEQEAKPNYQALAKGLVLQIFFLINESNSILQDHESTLPENLRAIKQYIEQNFIEISSVKEVADHFFYSREYVSRLFRQYFNTTVSNYIKARQIAYSQSLIEQGCSISEACYQSGFENMSTFIRTFRNISGTTPSEYRKQT
ncbi:MAG: helix-turn-helix transcriptional regulator [Clostridia bacterium]|nr:helix-turn-helix transcriptional regulator [Clostridia bacterium]